MNINGYQPKPNTEGSHTPPTTGSNVVSPKFDAVNYPSHYVDGGIETFDFIQAKKLTYCRGNAVKYICRAGKKSKETEVQDLEKAIWYLNKEIERLRGEKI